MTNRYSLWLIGGLAALFVFSIPLIVSSATAGDAPEVRILRTGRHLATLTVSDSGRVLFVNSDDRRVTRSIVGRLARPWETDTKTLITPADDRAGVGAYEAMQHPAITQVVVLGLPGADPIWSAIERESASRGIDLHYLGAESQVDALPLAVYLRPASEQQDAFIEVRHGFMSIGISTGETPPPTPHNVAVIGQWPQGDLEADLAIVPVRPETRVDIPLVVTRDNEVVRITLANGEIRVSGGRLFNVEK